CTPAYRLRQEDLWRKDFGAQKSAESLKWPTIPSVASVRERGVNSNRGYCWWGRPEEGGDFHDTNKSYASQLHQHTTYGTFHCRRRAQSSCCRHASRRLHLRSSRGQQCLYRGTGGQCWLDHSHSSR